MSKGQGRSRRGGEPNSSSKDPPAGHNRVDFDPLRIFQLLDRHGVSYVVIGGVAGRLYGSPILTDDLDICYERSKRNREALAKALRDLQAAPRDMDLELPFQLDAATLGLGDSFTFSTDAGKLDCLATPEGTAGYGDLIKKAVQFDVAGCRIKAVSLEDLMRMKKAAGRAKDKADLEILGALQSELDDREKRGRHQP